LEIWLVLKTGIEEIRGLEKLSGVEKAFDLTINGKLD